MNTATFNTNRQGKRIKQGLFALLAMVIFMACEKTDKVLPQQPPPPVDTTAYLQLSVTGVQLSGKQLYALLSVDGKTGQPVITNKKVTLDYIQGTYKTDKIELARGEYSLSKFIVVSATDTALFATPRANTPKATAVTKPLAFNFAITGKGINGAEVQTVKIVESDQPAAYGYTTDDFGYHAYISVQVMLTINVGQVSYDSLPGKLKIQATGDGVSQWTREIDLQRGISEIKVPEQYSAYQFEVNKWNTIARKNLDRSGLQSNMVIALEASRMPKRLVEEKTFIENAVALVPDSRTEFFYTGNGKLGGVENLPEKSSAKQPGTYQYLCLSI